MLKTLLTIAAAAPIAIAAASAAPVTVNAGTSGSVSNQNIFGGRSAAGFSDSLRIGPSGAQIYAEAQASTGTVDSSVDLDFSAQYDDSIGLSEAGSVMLALLGSADADFDTNFGAGFEAGVATTFLNIGDVSLIDRGYSLSASGSSTIQSSGTGRDSQGFARVGTPEIPGISIGGGVSANATQRSTLDLTGITGTLTARNAITGTFVSTIFSIGNSGIDNFNFDLGEVGRWDLSVSDIGVGNAFSSVFGLSVSGDFGASLGFGCGNPARDDDNGGLCVGDAGVEVESSSLDLANIPGFALLYSGFKNQGLGSITIFDDTVSEVPIPGALPLMASVFAVGGLLRRRKAK